MREDNPWPLYSTGRGGETTFCKNIIPLDWSFRAEKSRVISDSDLNCFVETRNRKAVKCINIHYEHEILLYDTRLCSRSTWLPLECMAVNDILGRVDIQEQINPKQNADFPWSSQNLIIHRSTSCIAYQYIPRLSPSLKARSCQSWEPVKSNPVPRCTETDCLLVASLSCSRSRLEETASLIQL